MSTESVTEGMAGTSAAKFRALLEQAAAGIRRGDWLETEKRDGFRWLRCWYDAEAGAGLGEYRWGRGAGARHGVVAIQIKGGQIVRWEEFAWEAEIQLETVPEDEWLDQIQTVLTSARVAVLRRDRATLGELLMDDYICVYPDGRVLDKGERIRLTLSAPPQAGGLSLLESQDQRLRLYGETAIVTERIRQGGVRSGIPTVEEWVATTVLCRQANRWKVASSQLTPVRGR